MSPKQAENRNDLGLDTEYRPSKYGWKREFLEVIIYRPTEMY